MFSFRIGQFFCLLCYFSPSVNFSYCLLLGHRFESSPFCQLWHLMALWNSGLSNVDVDRYGVLSHCRTLRLAWNLYSWFSLVFYDNTFCVLQLAATYAQKVCDIGIFCYCVMLLLIRSGLVYRTCFLNWICLTPFLYLCNIYIKMLGYNSVNHIQLKIVKD